MYIPQKFIAFWILEALSYYTIWDDEQLSSQSRPRNQPHALCLAHFTPWNVSSCKLSHLWKQSQRHNHKFLSLCYSSAHRCHTHRTSSSPSSRSQAPGPSRCAHIPLSLTLTCVSSPHPQGRRHWPEVKGMCSGADCLGWGVLAPSLQPIRLGASYLIFAEDFTISLIVNWGLGEHLPHWKGCDM